MMKEYDVVVDVFFSEDEDKDATVISLTAKGKNPDEARKSLEQDILDGKVEMPEGYVDFYIWDILEEDILKAS